MEGFTVSMGQLPAGLMRGSHCQVKRGFREAPWMVWLDGGAGRHGDKLGDSSSSFSLTGQGL